MSQCERIVQVAGPAEPRRVTQQLVAWVHGSAVWSRLQSWFTVVSLALWVCCGAASAAVQEPQFTELPSAVRSEGPRQVPEPALRARVAGSQPVTDYANGVTKRGGATGESSRVPEGTSTNAQAALDDKHALAIGDHVSFRIEEDQEEPKALVVADSGELEVPYVGRVIAENKTCRQLARELKAALEKKYYYQATVIIAVDQMAKSRGKVYVVGPVRAPGPQEVPSDEVLTLSKAIMRAGGFNDFADKHNVKVTRKGRSGDLGKKIFTVDVGQIFDKGKVELDLPLEPDDLILVPERLVRF